MSSQGWSTWCSRALPRQPAGDALADRRDRRGTSLPLTMGASLWISLWLLAPPEVPLAEPKPIVLLMSHLSAVAWCFGGAALAAAAWARRRGAAQALVGVGAVAFYLMEVVGEAWPRAVGLPACRHFTGSTARGSLPDRPSRRGI